MPCRTGIRFSRLRIGCPLARASATLVMLVLVTAGTASVTSDYTSIKRKFKQIEQQKLAPGTRIPLTPAELNAYVQKELPEVAPPGIRDPVVVLNGNNAATGTALIDFLKLRSAEGKPPGFILRTLLAGEHELSVTTSVKSSDGMATVNLERVEIEGIPISGAALDFLVRNYLIPNYPEAKIGKPFKLKWRIDRIEVTPKLAWVVTH